MKLYFHYCPSGFSNCYVLGTDFSADEKQRKDPFAEDDEAAGESPLREPPPPREASPLREAIIIDPGIMDMDILNLIEDNNYTLRGVLITHDHPHHVQGLKTVRRIYDVDIYAINPAIGELKTVLLRDGDRVNIGPFKTEVISIPGHSADSAVFKIDRLLFTGDSLTAGLLGSTASSYAAATQVNALRSKILALPGDYTILPGHGPPSSLRAERRFNLGLNSFEQQKSRRPSFSVEF